MRSSKAMRALVQETRLASSSLIMPYFVVESGDANFSRPIEAMPGQNQLGLSALLKRVEKAVDSGLGACLLFGLPAHKDDVGSGAYAEDGIVQKATRLLKDKFPELLVITDVCLCEYTAHGHCGVLEEGGVANDPSLQLLASTALSHARAGADIVAPSAMMDGCIATMRQTLDEQGFSGLPIMAYAAKYASAFYGPFREAADSAPKFGDRKAYQMPPSNAREALLEIFADIEEGADIVMVKPAGPYLDIIRQARENTLQPLAAYQVSGEYSMLMAAIGNGWLNQEAAILESLLGIKRAGADIIISYFTEYLLEQKLL